MATHTSKYPNGAAVDAALDAGMSVSHKNLLHNWDFRNPANQRGATAVSAGYIVDRWQFYTAGGGSATVNLGYLALATNGNIYEKLENTPKVGNYTVSVMNSAGTIYSASGMFDGTNPCSLTLQGCGTAVIKTTDFSFYPASYPYNIAAIKFELGSASTLANDPPADLGEQLALCERFSLLIAAESVRAVAYTANTITFTIPTPCTMRINPSLASGTLTVYNLAGTAQTGFTYSCAVQNNAITITATKTSHGLTDATLTLASTLFSADI